LVLLTVDPAFQRRGVGKLLVKDGVDRAHAQGLSLFVCGSKKGVPLYESQGFKLKETPKVTRLEFACAMLVNEPPK
jgi:GNAT superfamily N-acetyltransferase